MPSMINNTVVFRPARWIGLAALAVVVAYMVGLGVNVPAPAAQCMFTPPSATTPAATR